MLEKHSPTTASISLSRVFAIVSHRCIRHPSSLGTDGITLIDCLLTWPYGRVCIHTKVLEGARDDLAAAVAIFILQGNANAVTEVGAASDDRRCATPKRYPGTA